MERRKVGLRELMQPLMKALEGKPVPHVEVIWSGRLIAEALVRYGRPISITGEDPWAGVWNLEHLTDEEAAAWGMRVATRVCRV